MRDKGPFSYAVTNKGRGGQLTFSWEGPEPPEPDDLSNIVTELKRKFPELDDAPALEDVRRPSGRRGRGYYNMTKANEKAIDKLLQRNELPQDDFEAVMAKKTGRRF